MWDIWSISALFGVLSLLEICPFCDALALHLMLLVQQLVERKRQLQDWHSEECKLTPTLTFDLLTSGVDMTYASTKFGDGMSSVFLFYSAKRILCFNVFNNVILFIFVCVTTIRSLKHTA